MEYLEKIEIKKLVPVVAKISAGKSKLLNTLLNINFLECKAGIATKFINILKYNPKIEKPLFYHLKVINLDGKYEFYKDLSEEIYEGEENIIEANKAVNKKLCNENIINYENLFYMTEINTEPFIPDKEYLEDHYLCDIPGLSEYQENSNNEEVKKKEEKKENEIESEDKEFQQIKEKAKEIGLNPDERKKEKKEFNENIIHEIPKKIEKKKVEFKPEDDIYYEVEKIDNKNKTYLTEIFNIIKGYINGAIIILTQDNYKSVDNYEMIAQFRHIIKKQITNFLIILNKMDLSKNPKKDIRECKGTFAKYFPKFRTFNINFNTFIPISVNKLKNELLMNKDFKSLIYCHFYNFLENLNLYIATNRLTNELSFINHLKNIIINLQGQKTKKDFEDAVNELNKSSDISKIDKEINSVMSDLENEFGNRQIKFGFNNNNSDDSEDEEDNDDDDIDSLNPSFIMKYFYKERNSLKPYISEESNNLLNYFKNRKSHSIVLSNQKEKKEKNVLNQKIKKILQNLNNNILESKFDINKISSLIFNLQKVIADLKLYNYIFIPFIGEIGSGKSTIINGIIGEDVLPTEKNECTKRGIVIRYLSNNESDINLRKAYFRKELIGEKINYYIESEEYIIGKGLEQVRGILNALNYTNYNENEEDSFYYIRTKIKLFDDLGLDDSLKKMIFLIDLPGFGNGNKFEQNIFPKLMSISNCFVFTVKNTVIKEQKTRDILKKLFDQAKQQKNIITSKLLQSSLFILNDFENQKNEEFDMKQTRTDIIEIVKGFYNEEEKDLNNINLCFFNAKLYNKYFKEYNYFFNLKNSIQLEFRSYLKKNQVIFKTPESYDEKPKPASFCEFLISQLTEKNKILNPKNKKQIFNKEIEKNLNGIFQALNFNMNEILVNSNKISQQFALGQENITNNNSLKESNFEELKKNINSQIEILNETIHNNLEQEINNLIKSFDAFFAIDFTKEKDYQIIQKFKDEIKQIQQKLVNIYKDSQNKYFNIIEKYKNKIKESLNNKKDNIQKYLEEKNYKEIIKEIDTELKSNLGEFNDKIEMFLENIYSETDEINKQFINSIKSLGDDQNLNLESFRDYFAKQIGTNGGNLTEDMINEIRIGALSLDKIHEEKGFKKWISSLFSKVNYFKNSIDIILNSFVQNMDNILYLLIEKLTSFVERTYRYIDNKYQLSTDNYTKEQQEIINLLKIEYKENKYKIEKLKNQLVNKDN